MSIVTSGTSDSAVIQIKKLSCSFIMVAVFKTPFIFLELKYFTLPILGNLI